jgi:hypothetical protein
MSSPLGRCGARISSGLAVMVLCIAGTARPAVAVPCELLSDVALDRMTFRLVSGVSVSQLLNAVQLDWPDVSWTLLDQEAQRGYYLVHVLAPAIWTDVEWDLFHDAMDGGYPGLAYWLEFVSADEAPEGGTGSTFVDGIADLTAWQVNMQP